MNERLHRAPAHVPDAGVLAWRREMVFLVLAGLFLGTLAMLNLLGITRFVDLSFSFLGLEVPMFVAVGVLPYPLTFLATDLLSELYGKRRANAVVWVGLLLNVWLVFILWLGGSLPPELPLDPATGLPSHDAPGHVFFEVKALAFGAVAASMAAYLAAQFADVWLFHFWRDLTKGRHLWLRNNGSTMVSQLVDSVAVILITHYFAHALPIDPDSPEVPQLLTFIGASYTFKFLAAALDTPLFYAAVLFLRRYLALDHPADEPEAPP